MPEKYKLVTLNQTLNIRNKMKKTILAIAVLVGVSTANLSIAADKVKKTMLLLSLFRVRN